MKSKRPSLGIDVSAFRSIFVLYSSSSIRCELFLSNRSLSLISGIETGHHRTLVVMKLEVIVMHHF